MDVRVGPWRRLNAEELMLSNCGTVKSPLDSKKIKPVAAEGNQPWIFIEGNQPWIFIGKTDAEPEAPVLWPPDVKSWLIGKDPDSGKDWRRKEKVTEDEMISITDSMNMNLR